MAPASPEKENDMDEMVDEKKDWEYDLLISVLAEAQAQALLDIIIAFVESHGAELAGGMQLATIKEASDVPERVG